MEAIGETEKKFHPSNEEKRKYRMRGMLMCDNLQNQKIRKEFLQILNWNGVKCPFLSNFEFLFEQLQHF